MIARNEVPADRTDVWSALAALLPKSAIAWRQDGRPAARDGRFFARFVAFIEANTVRERLDAVCPGEWDLTMELLPPLPLVEGESNPASIAFKARLQILGVIREDVGTGKDYKQASTDAFKRVAVRFGVGHELYDYEQNWVQVDGDGKFAKPIEDPGIAYARRYGPKPAGTATASPLPAGTQQLAARAAEATAREGDVIHDGTGDPAVVGEPFCPVCSGRMWDNRLTKRNPKAPDYKCRDRGCDGVIWPPRDEKPAGSAMPQPADDNEEIPF